MLTVMSKMTVVFPARWRALTKGVVTMKSEYPTIISFVQDDLNNTGMRAAAYLRDIIEKEVYGSGADTARIVDGEVEPNGRTGKMMAAARFIKSDRAQSFGTKGPALQAGIFDLRVAKKMTSHGRTKNFRYWDALDKGTQPYIMTRRQMKAYFRILKHLKRYDKGVSNQFASIRKKGGSSGGGVHPGIRPLNLFSRTMLYWRDELNPYLAKCVARYLDYAVTKEKPYVLQSEFKGGSISSKQTLSGLTFGIKRQ